jgi:hypothetical protein
VLDNNEHLIPKNWLDIVVRDPLPLLKITLKFRSKADKTSLALIVREREFRFAEKYISDLSASDNDGMSLATLMKADQVTSAISSLYFD